MLSYQKTGTFTPPLYHPLKSLSFSIPETWYSWYTQYFSLGSKYKKQFNSNQNQLPASLHRIHVSGVLLLQPPQDAAKIESNMKNYKCGLGPFQQHGKTEVSPLPPNDKLFHGMFTVSGAFAPTKLKMITSVSKCSFFLHHQP